MTYMATRTTGARMDPGLGYGQQVQPMAEDMVFINGVWMTRADAVEKGLFKIEGKEK